MCVLFFSNFKCEEYETYSMNLLKSYKYLLVSFKNLFSGFLALKNFRSAQIFNATSWWWFIANIWSWWQSWYCVVVFFSFLFCVFFMFYLVQTCCMLQMILVNVHCSSHILKVKPIYTLRCFNKSFFTMLTNSSLCEIRRCIYTRGSF